MLYADLIDVPVEVFGGYTPAIPPQDLPPGASPFCEDVEFPMGSVRTRGGLKSYFPGNSAIGAASVNGLKTYSTPNLAKRLMLWSSFGSLYKENPQGTLNLLAARPQAQGTLYQSNTLFGREYQSFYNSLGGADIPRQYDDTNWDRVSQDGPGASPTAQDEVLQYTIGAAGVPGAEMVPLVSIAQLSQQGNLCTVTFVASYFAGTLQVAAGDKFTIAAATVAGYNGNWVAAANATWVPGQIFNLTFINPTTGLATDNSGTGTIQFSYALLTFTVAQTASTLIPQGFLAKAIVAGVTNVAYDGTWRVANSNLTFGIGGKGSIIVAFQQTGIASSGTGTVNVFGSIGAGLHQVSVAFITRQGFITKPALPPGQWISAGNKRSIISTIPTGPPNIVARLLIFTPVIIAPAVTGTFYSLPNGSPQIGSSTMLINDNVTTQFAVDFSDAVLITGFQATYLFTQRTLGESSWTGGYNSRTAWMGERIAVQNAINLQFDGGFGTDGSGNLFPLGWTEDAVSFAGGGSSIAQGLVVDWADAYVITGDGVTGVRGKISQLVQQDYFGAPVIQPNVSYGVRARISVNNALLQGTVHINLFSPSLGITYQGISRLWSTFTPLTFSEVSVAFMNMPIVNPPADLVIQIFVDGTPTNNGKFIVDSVELFPVNIPFNYSTAWLSHAFNPESFDNTTSQIQIRPNDGQQLRSGFPMRNNYYFGKDNYLCYVTDDGQNEPASWAINEVSATIGIAGPNACDWTEEWGVFAHRTGAYICWGSDPVKITQEIEEDASLTGKVVWSSINWAFGFTIWVRIDQTARKILIGAPINGATTPNIVFVLDYKWLDSAQDIAASPMVTYSAFTGKILAHGRGRRWAYWNMAVSSMCFAERNDGTAQPFFGNSINTGDLWQQLPVNVQSSDQFVSAGGPVNVAINGTYQSYFAPSGMEEQGLQLGGHQKLLGYLKWSVRGAGNFLLSIISGSRTTVLRNYVLSLTPPSDSGRGVNIKSERFSFTVSTNAPGSWFQLEKWIFCMKKAPTMLVRGTNT